MDGMVNWEASTTADGDRFSQNGNSNYKIKSTKSFDDYLLKKAARAKLKNEERKKRQSIPLTNTSH